MSKISAWKIWVGNDSHLNYEKLPVKADVDSLDELSNYCLPAGAYTTFRTYEHGKALLLESHFKRLEETAYLAGMPRKIDAEEMRIAIRTALKQYDCTQDVRVRLTLDLASKENVCYISLEPLKVPSAEAYQNGVKLLTYHLQRHNPKAKLTDFIKIASEVRKNLPEGVNDVLMYDVDKKILEGSSCNFFAVIERELWTAERGVLSGITRSTVLEVAREAEVVVHLDSVLISNLPSVQEAFITSASRGVLPVCRIDDIEIGRPGEITQLLAENYDKRIRQQLEVI